MNKINSNFEGQTIFVGMDVHKSSWNLGIHLNDMFVKNVHQRPNPTVMANYLKQHFPGANYKAAYEAGKFGFWIQRQLTSLGIEWLVVNPADIPKSQKDSLQKTDPRDARNLGLRLQSGVLHGIHIPDEQQRTVACVQPLPIKIATKLQKTLTTHRMLGVLIFKKSI